MPVTTIPLSPTATPPLPPQNSVPSVNDTDLFPTLLVSTKTLRKRRASQSLTEIPELDIFDPGAFEDYRSGLVTYSRVLQKGNSDTQYASLLHANIRGFPRFLDLPLELREKVYGIAIETHPTCYPLGSFILLRWHVAQVQPASSDPRSDLKMPPICKAMAEALPVWIRSTSFYFDTAFRRLSGPSENTQFLNILENIKRGLQSIRVLHINHTQEYSALITGEDPYMDMIKKCPGLRTLRLISMTQTSEHSTQAQPDYQPSIQDTVEKIVGYFGLEELFHCQKLQELYLAVRINGVEDHDQNAGLHSWMQNEFKRRNNQIVHVRSVHVRREDQSQ